MTVRSDNNRFGVYDMMDAVGAFKANPANRQSPNYRKVNYPKMLYHPKAARRVIVPAEIVLTPMGPQRNNEQVEIENVIVYNKEEEEAMVAEGWHRHPALAMAANGEKAPPMGSMQRISDLEAENQRLQEEMARLKAMLANGGLVDAPGAAPGSRDVVAAALARSRAQRQTGAPADGTAAAPIPPAEDEDAA